MDVQNRIIGLLFPSEPPASGLLQSADQGAGIPWWIWALIVIGVLILLWSWFTRPKKKGEPPAEIKPSFVQPQASSLPPVAKGEPAAPAAAKAVPLAEESIAPVPAAEPVPAVEAPSALAAAGALSLAGEPAATVPAAEEAVASIPEAPTALAAVESAEPAREAPERPVRPSAPAEAAPPQADDLTAIEGIGPKVASLLRAEGITTFAELAAADPARLKDVLKGADLQMMDPATWPMQARLAADGKWEELKALQEQLKGGRHVSDDLTVLEGVGPRVSSLLNQAGIWTFAQLSAADPAHIREVLRAAGLSMMDPASWPQQARMAADGKWDELKSLQEHLKGGRRV